MTEACRLCDSENTRDYAHANKRDYVSCDNCGLVFVRRDQLPSVEEEKAEYDLHDNDPHNKGYRRHLERLTVPLVEGLATSARGFDFGSGPTPAIATILKEQGYSVISYDPIYFEENYKLMFATYDFVACSEVVEHFHHPGFMFKRLANMLEPGGRLGIMTQMLVDGIDFESWYYPREISHVAFYRPETMEWIGREFGLGVELLGRDVVLFEQGGSKRGKTE